jgi:site-specific DNA recombinase
VVNEEEAERVREIFRMFADRQSLIGTVGEINSRGWMTKSWTTQKARTRVGVPFRWPTLRGLLTNVLYVGLMRHKQELVAGQQLALVDSDLFQEVGAILKEQERGPLARPKQAQDALLGGLLYCHSCGVRMMLTYTKKPYGKVGYYLMWYCR